jgi:hypothetical protein
VHTLHCFACRPCVDPYDASRGVSSRLPFVSLAAIFALSNMDSASVKNALLVAGGVVAAQAVAVGLYRLADNVMTKRELEASG